MCGSSTGSLPCQACQSDRHNPVARTANTTPPSGHAGSGTSVRNGAYPYAEKTTALTARNSTYPHSRLRGTRERDVNPVPWSWRLVQRRVELNAAGGLEPDLLHRSRSVSGLLGMSTNELLG